MEVCEICHREITSDQKYKVYQWNRLAHLTCYNKVFWLGIKLLIPAFITFIAGMIMTLLGAMDLSEPIDDYSMMSKSSATAVLVVGVILLVIGIALIIAYLIKYFAIRKNPPIPEEKNGPFTPIK